MASLPGVSRYGVNKLVAAVKPLVELGLSSVSRISSKETMFWFCRKSSFVEKRKEKRKKNAQADE